MTKESILLSVILLFDEKNKDLILSTMASLKEQTLLQEDFEIIVGEKKDQTYAELLQLILTQAHGEYIFIINAGDKIDPEYLKRSLLVLRSCKGIGFTYGTVKKFGLSEGVTLSKEFDAKRFFFYNVVVGAVYRGSSVRRVASSLGQVGGFSKEIVRHYLTNKIIALGYWGKPIKDSIYYLFTDFSINNISKRSLNYETLQMLRMLWPEIIFIGKAQKNYLKFIQQGGVNDVWFPRPIQRIFGLIFGRLFSFNIKYIPLHVVSSFLFSWRTFKNDFLKKVNIPSEAEILGGFQEKPDYRKFKIGCKDNLKDTIIFAHDAWVLGGGENVLMKWIKSIVSDEPKIRIIDIASRSLGDEAFMRVDFRKFVHEQYALDKLSHAPKQSLRICWDIIVSERPKLLFIMSNSYFYALTPIIKKYYPEIVIVDLLHNEYADDPGWFSISDEYKEYLDHRIVLSETWKNVLVGKYGEKEEKIIVCENGVDINKFDPAKFNKKELKDQYDLSSDKRIVTFIGRINRQKNPEVFLKLAKSLLSDARFEFFFVGNKDDQSEYVQEIEAGIERSPNIRYFGHSDHVPEILAVSDVLILPSKFEGDPLISLEAAAMNIPIIASDIVGFRKQVQEGQFGILYELRGEDLDAKAIKDILLRRQDEINACAQRGREFVKRSRDLKHKEMIYKDILQSFLRSDRGINK